jgi:Fe2+ or Zn2+ uptake regulation protein
MLRFEKISLVRRTMGLDGTTRWSIDRGGPQNFHITCRRTGTVAELDADSSAAIRRVLASAGRHLRARGYTDVKLNVAFHGVKRAAGLTLLGDHARRQAG